MALLVWLPLNGNLNNQGLSDVTVTNNGATIDDNGKIGLCYSFDGSNDFILCSQNFLSNSTKEWSYACWMKPNISHNGCLFSCRNSTNTAGITIFYYNSQWFIDSGNRWTLNPRVIISPNNWYHVCVTRSNHNLSLYINGILDSSISFNSNLTNVCNTYFTIGNSQNAPTTTTGNPFNGRINDVRIYDHCLSPKEVKEISKGLILHYPLNNYSRNDLLPPGVELYDYIESTGTLWIEIPYYSNIIKVTLEYSYTSLISNLDTILTVNGNQCYLTSDNQLRMWNNNGSAGGLESYTLNTKVKGIYAITSSNSTIQINNEILKSFAKYSIERVTCLFAYYNPANYSTSYKALAKLYSCKIESDGILIHSFSPCTYYGEPGLWDSVENKFYKNQGTGTFILGNKITMTLHQYLEKTGTTKDYIDTGVSGYTMNNTRCLCKMSANIVNADSPFFGSRGSYYLFYLVSANYFWPTSKCETINGTLAINTPYIVDWNKGYLTVTDLNGNLYLAGKRSSNYVNNDPMYIYNFNPLDSSRTALSKIYYFKIWVNDILVRDFVPVSYNNTPGFWDKVEWKFYANSGPGTLTLGEEIKNTEIQDCSGYKNNGTVGGDLQLVNSLNRYEKCIAFDGTSNNILTSISGYNTEYTFTLWVKFTKFGVHLLDCRNSSEVGYLPMYIYSNGVQIGGSSTNFPTINYPFSTGVWYHISVVYTNDKGILYINGNKVGENNTTRGYNYQTTLPVHIGSRLNNTSWFGGNISDFRIYATALSDSDILELYNTSASIDNMGNSYCYEYNDESLSGITKNGIIKYDLIETNHASIYKEVNPNLLLGTYSGVSKMTKTENGSTEFGKQYTPTELLLINTNYTISMEIRGTAPMRIYTLNTGGNVWFLFLDRGQMSSTEYKLYQCTFKVTGDRTINKIYICTAYGTTQTGDWFEVKDCSIKLEEGTSCTPWVPAISDETYEIYNLTLTSNQLIEI